MPSSRTGEPAGAERLRRRLVCPDCHGELSWESARAACAGCGAVFPVSAGVLSVEGDPALDTQRDHFRSMWARSRRPRLPPTTRRRLALFPRPLAGTILESGAGDARLARAFPELDIMSSDLVAEGIADLGPRAAVCPADRLPFRDGTFDLVVAFEVLEHLPEEDLPAAAAELRRVLKDGGEV